MTGSSRGFTLVEALVVIAIIGILSLIGFNSLNLTSKRDASRNSALDFRNAVRTIQEQAQTNKIALSGTNANSPADYYGILLSCQGTGCGIQSGRYVADSYKFIRVERCTSLDCHADPTNCGASIVSTVSLPKGITITTDVITIGTSSVYPRIISFAKGSSLPVFYAIDSSNYTTTPAQTSLILTTRGDTLPPTVTVFGSSGRVESTNTF